MPILKGPTLLWTVATTVQRTNERAAGITGANPATIANYYRSALIQVKLTAQTNLALTAFRVRGSLTGGTDFSQAGSTYDLMVLFLSPPTLVSGETILMAAIPVGASGSPTPGTIVPPFLLMEYSTAAPGATPVLTFEVRMIAVGDALSGADA